jgi:hypothetical protein
VDVQNNVIRLEYDLRKIKFESIEKSMDELGLKLSRKLLERWKRGMVKFNEQNELDNLKAPVSSCCKDPHENAESCDR